MVGTIVDGSSDGQDGIGSRLPIILGAVGVCFGVAGLYLAMSNRGDTAAFEAKIAAAEAHATQAVARYEEQNERVNAIDAQLHALLDRVEGEFQKISVAMTAPKPAKVTAQHTNAAPANAAEARPEGAKGNASYTIQSGDTFAKIAQRNGMSVQALLNANPSVDPRHLKVGQTIALPAAR